MKQIISTLVIFSISFLTFKKVMASKNNDGGSQAGVAIAFVTPNQPVMMEGFAFEKKPFEFKLTDLYVRRHIFLPH